MLSLFQLPNFDKGQQLVNTQRDGFKRWVEEELLRVNIKRESG